MKAGEIRRGDIIGHWRVTHLLGDGLSGSVFEVKDICGSRPTRALKIHCGPSVKVSEAEFRREMRFVKCQPIPVRTLSLDQKADTMHALHS